MSTFEFAAESLVRTYLKGRTMDPVFYQAVVWMAEKRLAAGATPTLDATLRWDIDSQAETRKARDHSAAPTVPTICVSLHRAYVISLSASTGRRSEGTPGHSPVRAHLLTNTR